MSVFGRIEEFDYAFQVTNTGLSSRPATWDAGQTDFSGPTWTGRLGYRPNAAWNLGVSGSVGAYIVGDPRNQLPKGTSRVDYPQQTLGFDAAYAHHHLEVWGELILSRFEVPRAGDADTLAYFIEAKYKFTESLFAALRWNQQFFNRVSDGLGDDGVWDRGLSRVDVGLGWRFNRWVQAKIQYSFGKESGPDHNGWNLLASMLTFRF